VSLSLPTSYWPTQTLTLLILPASIYTPFPSVIHFNLQMEAVWPSKTYVSYTPLQCHNSEDHNLNHCQENLISSPSSNVPPSSLLKSIT
jgi:hypothetical protein